MSYFVIIRGPLGSGKSTVANELRARLKDATVFSIDRLLEEHGLTQDREDGYVSQKSFFKVNEIVAPVAEKLLAEGTTVIFDGNFYWKSQIEDLVERLNRYRHEVFTLRVPLGLCIERDSGRDGAHGEDAAAAVYEKSVQFSHGRDIDAVGSVN